MKVKNINVKIKPLKQVLKDVAEVMEKIKKGEKVKPYRGVSFGSVESFREFFTPKRLQLLRIVKHVQPDSIYELAKLTKRDFKSVNTDIKILEKYGIIETKKIAANGRYKIKPIFEYDKVNVEIAM
jgi:predicted transcriptional regulator